MNPQMSSSYLLICTVLSLASAFHGQEPQLETFQQKKAYCASFAMKTVMADLTLPVAQSNFRHDLRDDSTAENDLSAYNSPLYSDILEKLKEISDTNWLSTLKLGEETSTYAKRVLNDFYKIRETCFVKLLGSDQNEETLGDNDYIGRLSSLRASKFRDEQLPGSPDDRMLKRGDRLSLNPSGWRKRRDTFTHRNGRSRNNEDFLRNMRQLYEKRRRRLQFNPTGW